MQFTDDGTCVVYKGGNYPFRTIVIFGQTEVNVAGTLLSSATSFCGSILGDSEAMQIDDMFAAYVPEVVLQTYTDEQLAEFVEEHFYDNEPTEPNTKMPFDWFDEHIDCCDVTSDDNGDEFYYKQAKDGIRVYNGDREYVTTIKGRRLDEPKFHVGENPKWAFEPMVLLDATYDAIPNMVKW